MAERIEKQPRPIAVLRKLGERVRRSVEESW